jgi:hypothetical protein
MKTSSGGPHRGSRISAPNSLYGHRPSAASSATITSASIRHALDNVRARHPNMVLLHRGSLHGAERIAACWAENRKVANSSQIGRGAATPRASSAPTACSRRCRLGAIVFAGSAISDNLTDKAKKPGIPLWHFDGDGAA